MVTQKGLKGLEVAVGLPHRLPYVEDLSDYEKEEEEAGAMVKAVVVHGVPTNWKINGVADCAGRIMGEVIGVRWLLNEGRRIRKAASSVVVYLQNEVFCDRVPMEGLIPRLRFLCGGVLLYQRSVCCLLFYRRFT